MSHTRGHRGRVDGNHQAVVRAFQACGWFTWSTAALGGGFPDLLVAKAGTLRQIEVKDGRKPASQRKLTALEAEYHEALAAAGCPVLVVESVDQVIALDRDLTLRET